MLCRCWIGFDRTAAVRSIEWRRALALRSVVSCRDTCPADVADAAPQFVRSARRRTLHSQQCEYRWTNIDHRAALQVVQSTIVDDEFAVRLRRRCRRRRFQLNKLNLHRKQEISSSSSYHHRWLSVVSVLSSILKHFQTKTNRTRKLSKKSIDAKTQFEHIYKRVWFVNIGGKYDAQCTFTQIRPICSV